ncbi:MAG: hypothetical protein Q7S27_04805 [Nanoarchaeota archaeon]|nr:hypothetical protein [Nanoarchaeota archaeon]
MTISIGLIPNNNTVMLIQDAEGTYQGIGFTQDIFKKIQELDDSSITGVIGSPVLGNEIIQLVKENQYRSGKELSDKVEQSYHNIRAKHFQRGVLAKYGFSDIREVIAPQQGTVINHHVVEEVLKASNNTNGFFSLELMLATNYDNPLLYLVGFPGTSLLFNNIKDYAVSGSGQIMAIEKMGVELENYRWKKELSLDEGIDVLMKAGKASEKHTGVGGPFEIVYLQRKKDEMKIIRPDQKKINMVMYLLDLNVNEAIMEETIKKMRDDKNSPQDLADYIKTHTKVGIEFDRYFGLK